MTIVFDCKYLYKSKSVLPSSDNSSVTVTYEKDDIWAENAYITGTKY